jgi:hypothetical protein
MLRDEHAQVVTLQATIEDSHQEREQLQVKLSQSKHQVLACQLKSAHLKNQLKKRQLQQAQAAQTITAYTNEIEVGTDTHINRMMMMMPCGRRLYSEQHINQCLSLCVCVY